MEKEIQLEQENIEIVSDVDIDVEKVDNVATVTITNSEGSTKSVDIYDGQDGKDGQNGRDATINGENTINIVAGDNIEIEQEDDTLTISSTGGSGGTSDYTQLENKPKINNVELVGNKSTSDLGINIPDVSEFITKDVNNLTNYVLKSSTGTSIELDINSSTYVVTLNLKNSDGTTISTDTIDLPLESVVVNGSYDNINKKIVLTLQSGSTIDIPVGDLVNGLQTEITSNNKLSADLVDDTLSTNKFVTANDKTTWSGKQDILQYTSLPTASATNLGKIAQYIGTTDTNYTQGYFYKVVSDGELTSTYSWQYLPTTNTGNVLSIWMSSNSKLYIIRNSNGTWTSAITSDIALQMAQELKNDICVNVIAGSGADTAYSHENDGLYYLVKEFGATRKYFFIRPVNPTVELTYPSSNKPYATLRKRGYGYYVNFNDFEWTDFKNITGATTNEEIGQVLSLATQYDTGYFTPTIDGQPATKRYVDDSISTAIGTALTQSY